MMSSPRKFAEKIALLQQKQAEGDAAFNTILNEVEAAKQRADRVPSTKRKLDGSTRKYEATNGMNNSDNNNYTNQSIKIDNNNSFNRLSLPPDNSSWRRTYSDSSLHPSMIPTAIAHYHAQHNNDDNNQQLNYDMNDNKLEPPPYNVHHQHNHLQVSNSQFQQNHYYDLNNNNYMNDRTNVFYPPLQQNFGSSPTNTSHTLLGTRYSGENSHSNVLMLPPNQHSRNGGSLPDLRAGNIYNNNNNQQLSFSTVPSPPTSTSQHCFRSSSPQQNSNGDYFMLEPQQQLPSNIGPLKQSPNIRRRHSPIGDVKQSSSSSRRHNSSSPDVSSTQQTGYRVEPQSPQSQSSYSSQNSPNLLSSPGNELTTFSPPQQLQQQSTDNQQHYFTLPTQFDQITLDNNFYTQQPSSPSSQQNHNHSSPTTPGGTNNFQQRDFYPPFLDDIPSTYCHNQTINVNLKSPTIPNIILTDVDSSKLDLSKELANDFSNPFDSLIDATDLQLNTDDFLLNAADLSVDPILCDDTFSMER